jgi:hypothetical protein
MIEVILSWLLFLLVIARLNCIQNIPKQKRYEKIWSRRKIYQKE